MSAPQTPYTKDLDGHEPLAAMADTVERIRALVGTWTPDQFERRYAPGKWSAREVLTHLAQTEMALGCRARMALTVPNYVAQSWDQDRWVAIESPLGGREALDALIACGRMNRAFFSGLTVQQRAIALSHPEYGSLTVDWLIHQMAGHQIHHLRQLERVSHLRV